MIPGPAALCEGTVVHRRVAPRHHGFTYPMSQVWFDPDHPEELCDLHPAWSDRRPAPVWYRRADFGAHTTGSLADEARAEIGEVLGRTPRGQVRILTQLRRWGWLFNPITLYLVWDDEDDATPRQQPLGVVLEVTNTPWKERTRYPLALDASDGDLTAEFDKAMHVSPFLDMDHRYRLRIQDRDDALAVDIDVVTADKQVVLHTALRLDRRPATRGSLNRSLWSAPLPTHRVSVGIHIQALRLWAKGVPIVAHPRGRPTPDHTPRTQTERRP